MSRLSGGRPENSYSWVVKLKRSRFVFEKDAGRK